MITISFDVDPSWGRKNDKYTIAKGQRRITLTKRYRAFVDTIALQARQWMVHHQHRGGLNRSGLSVAIAIVWASARKRGDIDAALSGTLDGLEDSGLLQNDGCIDHLEVWLSSAKRPAERGIVVQIWTA